MLKYVAFCVWLLACSITFSKFIQVVAFVIFFRGWVIFHFVDRPHFVYSLTSWCLLVVSTSWLLSIMLPWTFVYKFLCEQYVFSYFGYLPKSEISESYGDCTFNFLRNYPVIFHSGCTTLHSCHQCMRFLISAHPHQHWLLSIFKIIAILVCVTSYLIWFAFP